jgi:hypothetical protein
LPDFQKMKKRKIESVDLSKATNDYKFWQSKSFEERLLALKIINQNAWGMAGKNFNARIIKRISLVDSPIKDNE